MYILARTVRITVPSKFTVSMKVEITCNEHLLAA